MWQCESHAMCLLERVPVLLSFAISELCKFVYLTPGKVEDAVAGNDRLQIANYLARTREHSLLASAALCPFTSRLPCPVNPRTTTGDMTNCVRTALKSAGDVNVLAADRVTKARAALMVLRSIVYSRLPVRCCCVFLVHRSGMCLRSCRTSSCMWTHMTISCLGSLCLALWLCCPRFSAPAVLKLCRGHVATGVWCHQHHHHQLSLQTCAPPVPSRSFLLPAPGHARPAPLGMHDLFRWACPSTPPSTTSAPPQSARDTQGSPHHQLTLRVRGP
jgi:hypothetical protein